MDLNPFNWFKPVELVKEIGVTLDNLITSDEERGKLKVALAEISDKVKQREAEYEELIVKDRQNAREMQNTALQQDDVFSKRFVYYFAIGITTISFVYIFLITFVPIPESSVRFADTVLGFLLGVGLASIFQFFFGSSKGSKDKDGMTNMLLTSLKGKL